MPFRTGLPSKEVDILLPVKQVHAGSLIACYKLIVTAYNRISIDAANDFESCHFPHIFCSCTLEAKGASTNTAE
ncbi:hypothetical protein D3C76_1639830 [compost metagenome]